MKKRMSLMMNSLLSVGILLSVLGLAPGVTRAAAEEIVITPLVIDETGSRRQTIDREVRIKSNAKNRVELYAVISDLGAATGSRPTLSDWLEISRGVISLDSGAEKVLPLKIAVGPNALPGQYHAQVVFAHGGDRWEAEANSRNSIQPKIIVNYSLEERIIEKLNNAFFKTAKSINIEEKVDFSYRLKNVGNTEQVPRGSILIFDRGGAEVASLEVNKEGKSLQPNSQNDFTIPWEAKAKIGKFKARLEITYGSDNTKSVGDTLYFWALPKWLLYILAAILGLLLIMLINLFFKIKRPSPYIKHAAYDHVIDLKSRARK